MYHFYVYVVTGSQGETPWKDLKQSIKVKVGDVECLVQSQHVSNCDFLEVNSVFCVRILSIQLFN